jgi:predicted  nucleic acid-binding Zn-ribbon protein
LNVEPFLKLKEYDSLSKAKASFSLQIQDQQNRLNQLLLRKNQSLLELEELLQKSRELNQLLFETEKKLKSIEEQKSRLIDTGASEEKIKDYGREAQLLEEKGLETLTEIEANDQQIQDLKGFLTGLEKTSNEIKQEVEGEVANLIQKIRNLDLRLESIESELPPEFKALLVKTLAKKLALGPFTRIDQGSCYFCRYKISRVEESEIDMQKALKTCPQCSRIFLPYGA